jgi:uncharacterized damage-inducible protein DinB
MNNKLIQNIVQQLNDVMDQENWLDENFQKKIGELTEEQAFQRPLPELHSVAEIISHLLVWREESIRKLQGKEAKLGMDSRENWRSNEELKAIGWDRLKKDFFQSQQELIQWIENEPDEYLENVYLGGYKFKYLIEGLIHHDLYHLGQVGIIIKFLKLRNLMGHTFIK